MKIGDNVERTDPKGRVTVWEIETESQLKYFEGLKSEGFTFREVVQSE